MTPSTQLNFNGSFTQEKGLNTSQGGQQGGSNVVAAATAWSPNLSVFDASTGDYTGFQGYGATVLRNPVYLSDEINRNTESNTFAGNLSLSQKITRDLTFKIFGALQNKDNNNNTYKTFIDPWRIWN